ncbi:MAG: formate--tetrahydrofolate ligase [bacterium JZ-2024 1]
MKDISEVGIGLGYEPGKLVFWGVGKAKIPVDAILERSARGKLVLVTAMSPSPQGEGKTTVAIGLTDALNRIGKSAVVALREPSMGPVFGIKGGGTGAGRAQVVPGESINLHFTGDFHAVTMAHNLLSAAIDNHIYYGNSLDFDLRRIIWHRVVDLNDRALRKIVVGLGGRTFGFPREDRFDITAASEIMAILGLARDYTDLKTRLGNIVAGFTRDGQPVHARALRAEGSMSALLRDALMPNLVQTLEGSPAVVHTGPFGNIAHGTSSVLGTLAGLAGAEFVVQEAGFGSDLGGEKFLNLFCRILGTPPAVIAVVITLRGIKYHAGIPPAEIRKPALRMLSKGMENALHHLQVLKGYGRPVVAVLNEFDADPEEESEAVQEMVKDIGFPCYRVRVYQEGGAGATDLAEFIASRAGESDKLPFHPIYEIDAPLETKIHQICTRVYGAEHIEFTTRARTQLEECERLGYRNAFVCIAKTQYSLSDDPKLIGFPRHFGIRFREVCLLGGAGFVVPIAGEIMTMPGLPRSPNLERIDLSPSGDIVFAG